MPWRSSKSANSLWQKSQKDGEKQEIWHWNRGCVSFEIDTFSGSVPLERLNETWPKQGFPWIAGKLACRHFIQEKLSKSIYFHCDVEWGWCQKHITKKWNKNYGISNINEQNKECLQIWTRVFLKSLDWGMVQARSLQFKVQFLKLIPHSIFCEKFL